MVNDTYSLDEKLSLIAHWYATHSVAMVQRLFYRDYQKTVGRWVVYRTVKRLQTTGSLNIAIPKDKPYVLDPEMLEEIKGHLHKETSIRKVARIVHISPTSVWKASSRILKLHPYRLHVEKELTPADKPLRVNFCKWFKRNAHVEFDLSDFYFSDESNFYLDGHVNTKNCVYWDARGNPPENHITQTTLNIKKIGVWAALSGTFLVGPYFYDDNMNGAMYRATLDRFHQELVSKMGVNQMQHVWFQQDGASPHTALETREVVRELFASQTVGKFLAIWWPPRSPDITPMDFFLWGYIKEIVFEGNDPPTSVAILKAQIQLAFDKIRADTGLFMRVWSCLLHRCNMIINKNGERIERTIKKRVINGD